ncbi:MAG: outer membrane beta-barrel protein [Candidatus Aminicenantes bacterium]|nr:outer membrane beta-barrel protein [Candidatus Aminicenantes bacterium]
MRKSIVFVLSAVWLAVLFPAEAPAQWYAGSDLGMSFVTFRTDYSYPVGTPDSYANKASGFEAGALLGYDLALSRTVTLGVELRTATGRARWELDTVDEFSGTEKGGPSRLRYEIPWTARASAVFKVRLLPDLALTGEMGLEWGSVRLNKTSAASTSYDFKGWSPGPAAGAGLEWRVSPALDLVARFAYAGYRDMKTTSRFPDGEAWESIVVRPCRLSSRVGVLFRIGPRPSAG